jgi:hypothetical protein
MHCFHLTQAPTHAASSLAGKWALIRDLERISRTARSIHAKSGSVHPTPEETHVLEQAAVKLQALRDQRAELLKLSASVQAPVLQQITQDLLSKSQVRFYRHSVLSS